MSLVSDGSGDGDGEEDGGGDFGLGPPHGAGGGLGECGGGGRFGGGDCVGDCRGGGLGDVGGQRGAEGGGTGGGASEGSAEAVEGALEAFSCGDFADAEGAGDFGGGLVLLELEEEGFAVGGGEAGEGGVEVGGDFEPERIGGGIGGGWFRAHGSGLLFVTAAGGLLLEGVGGAVAGGAEEPAVELRVAGEEGGFLRDEEEDGLRHVFGEGVIGDEAAGGGIDPIDVAADEFGEGRLVFAGGVGGEQLVVGHRRLRVYQEMYARPEV